MTAIEKNLAAYEADVDFPAVSGMEHLQMLMTRSELHRVQGQLTAEQRTRLAVQTRACCSRRICSIRRSRPSPTWRVGARPKRA